MESIKKIRKLLDRFYLGETTLEEEQMLAEVFFLQPRFRKS